MLLLPALEPALRLFEAMLRFWLFDLRSCGSSATNSRGATPLSFENARMGFISANARSPCTIPGGSCRRQLVRLGREDDATGPCGESRLRSADATSTVVADSSLRGLEAPSRVFSEDRSIAPAVVELQPKQESFLSWWGRQEMINPSASLPPMARDAGGGNTFGEQNPPKQIAFLKNGLRKRGIKIY